MAIPEELREYIEKEIIPRYSAFDRGHDERHVRNVIRESLRLAALIGADERLCCVIAAYHDTGLAEGRELHHIASGRILESDSTLRRWFREDEIEMMKEAVEDHRASSASLPRSIYGMIVSDADKELDPERLISRSVEYNLARSGSIDEAVEGAISHIRRKYGKDGYVHYFLPESGIGEKLEAIRALLEDREALSEAVRKAAAALRPREAPAP